MNSKKVGKVIGVALVVFLLAMVMQPCVVSAQDDPIDIYSVELNGVEGHIEVKPGEAVTVTVSYSLNTHVVTREDKSNVVVGFEHEAKICLIGETEWDTVTFDGWYHFKKIFGINAPTKPGTYYIYEVTTVGRTCEEMKVLYPNCFGLQQIADFEVIASESDERDQGAIKVTHVSLNFVGIEDWSNIEPGQSLEAKICYDYLYPWHLQKDEYRVVVGFEDTALFCIDEGIRREYPGNTGDGSDCTMYPMSAPMKPGMYSFYKTYTKGLGYHDAKVHYQNSPNERELIDHFEVRVDEPDEPDDKDSDKWKSIHVSAANIDLGIYGRPPYSITFLQRGDKLRMEINTSNYHSVGDGSLSISVSEDVGVYYDGGKVFEIPYPDPYKEIHFIETEFNPENKVGIALVSLIVGVVPCSGFCSNVAGFVMAVAEDSKGFSVYEEIDRTGHFEKPIELPDVFSKSRYLNDRDTVIVPWRVRLTLDQQNDILKHAKTVRVDLPDMAFPYKGTHDIVFCVDCKVYYKDVRHYIALPIKIGKQKIKA